MAHETLVLQSHGLRQPRWKWAQVRALCVLEEAGELCHPLHCAGELLWDSGLAQLKYLLVASEFLCHCRDSFELPLHHAPHFALPLSALI